MTVCPQETVWVVLARVLVAAGGRARDGAKGATMRRRAPARRVAQPRCWQCQPGLRNPPCLTWLLRHTGHWLGSANVPVGTSPCATLFAPSASSDPALPSSLLRPQGSWVLSPCWGLETVVEQLWGLLRWLPQSQDHGPARPGSAVCSCHFSCGLTVSAARTEQLPSCLFPGCGHV